ncbi:MAG: 4Fe-4S binding protein [Promethearchaeota archaeon]
MNERVTSGPPPVLVIGGGLAGIHVALELGDFGVPVYLIEKTPTLGGKALQLYRFFPTDDCALCVTSSDTLFSRGGFRKCFYRCGIVEHPNITLLTQAELVNVVRLDKGFKVTLKKHPRFVDEKKCIMCDKCAEICPVEVPNSLNFNLNNRKAVYLPASQAIPYAYVIDPETCLFEECEKCVKICPTDAIDLNAESEVIEKTFGTIVIATGFEEFDPSPLKEYGYGVFDDVITQVELARLIDPQGPTNGKLIKKGGTPIKNVTMLQCVGSRDKRLNSYCSSICCTYALKHALLLREQGVDVTLTYMDIRTPFIYEDYFERARNESVKFVKGRVSHVEKDPLTNKIHVHVSDIQTDEFMDIETDLVVLSAALISSKGINQLAGLLGLEIDKYGFFPSKGAKESIYTNLEDVYVCGAAQEPKDIPSSIEQANAVSMAVLRKRVK